MSIKKITYCIAVLLLALPCFAQSKEITSEEYWNVLNKARDDSWNINRRESRRTETFDKGNLVETNQWDSEYIVPDRSRVIFKQTVGNNTTKTETIEIGTNKFCRKNDGEWVFRDCAERQGTLGTEAVFLTRRTVSEAIIEKRKASVYVEYTQFGPEKDSGYSDFRYWIDENGRMLGEQMVRAANANSIQYKMIASFEYNPKNLKIEAPVRLEAPARINK